MDYIVRLNNQNKYSTEDKKIEICQKVKYFIDLGMKKDKAVKHVAEIYDMTPTLILMWDKTYKKFTSETSDVWTEEEKKNICREVKKIIKLNIGEKEAKEKVAKTYEITPNMITLWNLQYKIFSFENKNGYPEIEKQNVCNEVRKLIKRGLSIEDAKQYVAKKYEISPSVIGKWNKEIKKFSKNILNDTIQNSGVFLPFILANAIKEERQKDKTFNFDKLMKKMDLVLDKKSIELCLKQKNLVNMILKENIDNRISVMELANGR